MTAPKSPAMIPPPTPLLVRERDAAVRWPARNVAAGSSVATANIPSAAGVRKARTLRSVPMRMAFSGSSRILSLRLRCFPEQLEVHLEGCLEEFQGPPRRRLPTPALPATPTQRKKRPLTMVAIMPITIQHRCPDSQIGLPSTLPRTRR